MSFEHPALLLLIVPAVLLVMWAAKRSVHPMSPERKKLLLIVRSALLSLLILALAMPSVDETSEEQAVIFLVDHSKSLGEAGLRRATERVTTLLDHIPDGAFVGALAFAASPKVLIPPTKDAVSFVPDDAFQRDQGHATDLSAGLSLAAGLFPPGVARRIVVVSDAVETQGDAEEAARDLGIGGVVVDVVAVKGEARPDARIVRLRSSKARSHEGATLKFTVELQSNYDTKGSVLFFENGVQVASKPVTLKAGEDGNVTFSRTPEERNLYRYLARFEDDRTDEIPQNNEAMALVEVRGRPLLLLVEGDAEQGHFLPDAMQEEGIRLVVRPPESIPQSLEELAVFDGIVFSDVAAFRLPERTMTLVQDYVEQLGGGFLMIGGVNSFGVGGYYRTAIEDILPVRMQPPDKEERYSTALVLVIDRSGSMGGGKIDICKAAAIGTSEMLSRKDYIGVVAFSGSASWVVPVMRAGRKGEIERRIASLSAGGGTNIYPGMSMGYEGLKNTRARVKHMIVLTDGHSQGAGYEQLAQTMNSEGMTVSAVGVGHGADNQLLQRIAQAGGGKHYATVDPSSIPKIFSQDAATHLGKMVREQAFKPQQVERHAMLAGWDADQAPSLLGYVRTLPKATSQVPLVTDIGDPLLAHWRYGLGKVTAFTSDCKSRWAALWVSGWEGYGQFWGQVLREMARNPQGRTMDVRIARESGKAQIIVDLLEDAASFKNAADVRATIYYVPRGALGSSMEKVSEDTLAQAGPGRYRGSFVPSRPGIYLVRARAGAEIVSAGLVHETSTEVVSNRVNEVLANRIVSTCGGMLRGNDNLTMAPLPAGRVRTRDLVPLCLGLALLLFLADLVIRRWENVLGIRDAFVRAA